MSQKTKGEAVFLRNYPKVIFFYPVFLTSLVLWIIQFVIGDDPNYILGYVWTAVFFTNIFVVAFDFSSTKFFILILLIVIVLVAMIFLILPNVDLGGSGDPFNIGITAEFYFIMTIILGLVLGIVVLNARFNYWKIEQNEIYHKSGIITSAERYPAGNLRIRKTITDVFEFLFLRAGSITLLPGKTDEVIVLPTVLNINKKADRIDKLLSYISVDEDESV